MFVVVGAPLYYMSHGKPDARITQKETTRRDAASPRRILLILDQMPIEDCRRWLNYFR